MTQPQLASARASLRIGGGLALASGVLYTALATYLVLVALLDAARSGGASNTDPALGLSLYLGPFVLLNSVPATRLGYLLVRHQASSALRGAELLFGVWSIALLVWASNAAEHQSGRWLLVPLAIDVGVVIALRRGRTAAVEYAGRTRQADGRRRIEIGERWR